MKTVIHCLKQRGMPWLVGSILAYVGFLFLPVFDFYEAATGINIWFLVFSVITSVEIISNFQIAILALLLLAGSVTIIGGPFLACLMRGSLAFWWMLVVMSFLTFVGFSGLFLYGLFGGNLPPVKYFGFYCIVLSQVLNLVGFLRVKEPSRQTTLPD